MLSLLCTLAVACTGKQAHGEIVRADRIIFEYVALNQPDSVLAPLGTFLDLLGENIIHIGRSDSAGFCDRLRRFYSEPSLMQLYRDEQTQFADIADFETAVERGLDVLTGEFPEIVRPQVAVHVSGLNQSVVVTDSLLSVSADKYMGADYPLYVRYLPDHLRQNMRPDRMAADCLLGFVMANLTFDGNPDVLLDRMIHEGKLRYILSRLLPELQTWDCVGYSREQHLWCTDNEKRVWRLIQEHKHLTTPDYMTTIQYLQDAPHTAFLPADSPGRVGIWTGFRIVSEYMTRHPETSLRKLMEMTDYEELLNLSGYKP